ncbi:MAG: hypothetical protein IJT59_00115 [Desulfovibrionaceae bacterium]|nr:hypothetical protein [Desulfovibrionaceae bacterium]
MTQSRNPEQALWLFTNLAAKVIIKTELLKKYDIKSANIPNDDVLFHFQLLYYAEKYILLPDNLYNFRQTPLSITRGISATKPRKMLNQYIVLFDYLEGYIKKMPEISNDLRLKKAIYDFFNFVYLDACFLKGCNGHTMESIYDMMLPLLEEHFGNKAYMLMYLIEEYMKTRSLNAKK